MWQNYEVQGLILKVNIILIGSFFISPDGDTTILSHSDKPIKQSNAMFAKITRINRTNLSKLFYSVKNRKRKRKPLPKN